MKPYIIFLTWLLIIGSFCLSPNLAKDDPSIVIVGAGPSGIAAATRLLKNNFTNIKILEAEDRIGGRINTVHFGDANVDLGAEWCHGVKNNVVYETVKELGILHFSTYNMSVFTGNGNRLTDDFSERLMNFTLLFSDIEEHPHLLEMCEKVQSVGECFNIIYNPAYLDYYKDNDTEQLPYARAVSPVIEGYILSIESAFTWNDVLVTTNDNTEYETAEGGNWDWNGLGYKTFLNVLMQKYPPGKQKPLEIDDKINLNQTVTKIEYSNDTTAAVRIQCSDNSSFTADHVIFTASVGVLKANHDELFEPKLNPEKVAAIDNIGFGAVIKVILRFEEQWWTDKLSFIILWTPEERENMIKEYPKGITKSGKFWPLYLVNLGVAENNPKVLIAWYTGDVVPELEQLSDEEVVDGHKYLLDKHISKFFNVTHPTEMIRTHWYSNPNFRGTYSYESVKGHANSGKGFQRKLAEPIFNRNGTPIVMFAGEASSHNHFSTVHGAVDAGYREADRLINFYNL